MTNKFNKGMDGQLKERLEKWHGQISKIATVEKMYFTLEATEKSMYGKLFLQAPGKSIAEREAATYASEDWMNFKRGLSAAKSDYLNEKRILELKQKAFDAQYLTYKVEANALARPNV